MMDEKQKNAIRKWYSQNWILEAVQRTLDAEEWEELESLVHRTVLLPLSKHRELPDFMRNEKGGPLFPTSLSPLQDHKGWSEATSIGWEVVEERLGVSKEKVQGEINVEQDADWDRFMKSVEEREKSRKKK